MLDHSRDYYAKTLASLTTEDRLKFLGTVYNLGFGYSAAFISTYTEKEYFPFGPNYEGDQFAFGALSVDIYRELITNI